MKERVTFVHAPGAGVDPALIDVQDAGLLGPPIVTTREDRLTIPLDELPTELSELLEQVASLNVKWASPAAYDTVDPFSSRVSPGLHVSYTPLEDAQSNSSKLCALLKAAFGPFQCDSIETFTSSKSTFPSTPSSYYMYHELESLHDFVSSISSTHCEELDPVCQSRSRSLYTAASLDISYDASSKVARLTAFWPLFEQSLAVPASTARRTEVGIVGVDAAPNMQPHELGVSGLLTVLLEQRKPSPVLFGFPSRHRNLNATFSSDFLSPTGLHPSLQLSITSNQPPKIESSCKPYAYFTLPKHIFADRYQLADELFLASKNLSSAPYSSLPVDLEAPAYATKVWGSRVMLELAPPETGADPTAWIAEVPLHLRYLEPSPSGTREANVPYPALFWACAPELEADAGFSTSPFDRASLGYDSLFEPGTTFWHLNPRPVEDDRIVSRITVPVLHEEAGKWVGFGTSLAIVLGLAWVLWKLQRSYEEHGTGDGRPLPPIKKKNTTSY